MARLNQACSDGRLSLDELGVRLDGAYAATTRNELSALVADLPQDSHLRASPTGEQGPTRWWVSPIGGLRRSGHYRLPDHQVVVSLLGRVYLDLRGAELDGGLAKVTVISLVGGTDVVVPPGLNVDVGGFNLLGERDVRVDRGEIGAPSVALRLFGVLGGSRVRTKSSRLNRWSAGRLGRGNRGRGPGSSGLPGASAR